MANLLVKEISSELLREVNYAAAGKGLNQREWVIQVLEEATNGSREVEGDSGAPNLPRVRGGVPKQRRAVGATAVRGSSYRAPANGGTVEAGVRSDPSGETQESVMMRRHVQKHSPTCKCIQCSGGSRDIMARAPERQP